MKNLIMRVLFISVFITMLNKYNNYSETRYEIVDDNYYAKYKDRCIYIGDNEYLCKIEDNTNNILIEDLRVGDDPDIKIYDSYKINNIEDIDNILNILLEYEKEYPSNWKRTKSSMIKEWIVHNILCDLNYKTFRTRDIDLNNNDEEKYKIKVLKGK